ncbi:hypothetical protein [Nioella aestuarii]|uniref:hypothetical protein n=1 Tax=Nioella aestuarii TaxID=1662864 RepID=UPI003D7F2BB2
MTQTGGIIGGLALATALSSAAAAQTGSYYCLFSTRCDTDDCTSETFTVEIGLADHGDGLWLTYEGRNRSVEDVTPSDTPMQMFVSPGYEDNLMLTIFPTGEALHVLQDYQPGHGPRQQTAYGQCEVQ